MRLIRGAPGAGKTALVFREFKDAWRAGETARIIVPTATLVRHFQHELARDGAVFSPASIVSLSRFTAERAAHLTPANDTVVRSAVREELRRGAYPEFATVATTQGLADTVLGTIALFENAGATPAQLSSVRRLGPYASAFIRLWKAVQATLRERGFASRVEIVRAPAQSRGKIWMDGFLAFSPLEWQTVRALASQVDLTLTLPDAPVFNDVRRLALALGAEEKLLPGGARKPQRTIVAAASMERETDEIARRILELREQGTAFREIGIAIRDVAGYLPLLQSTFERCNIPARFYFSVPLAPHPAAVFLNGVIDNAIDGWEFGAALDTLRAHPGWGRSAWFDRFDFRARESMPGRGAQQLLALAEGEEERGKLAACFAALAWTDDTVRVKDWIRRFLHMAETLYRPGLLSVASNARELSSARTLAAGLRAWMEAIASVDACWPSLDTPVSLREFWDVARQTIEGGTLPVRDERADVVHVMNAFEARQWDVHTLFVCGMTDRMYPQRTQPDLLFNEADLERIAKSGIEVRRPADIEKQEEALFVSLETRASASLVMSYPTHDASGRASERSTYIDRQRLDPSPARLCAITPAMSAPLPGRAGTIGSKELLEALASQHAEISATALEDLAQCRFKFFGSKALALKPRPERPRERLNPRITGTILHKAMEIWLQNARQDSFLDTFDSTFEAIAREKHLPAGYDLEVKRFELRGIAAKLSGIDRWRPDSSEQEVTLTATLPNGVRVKCRIDRLDTFEGNRCIIVDYKSGAVKNIAALTKSQTRLQGPLYALAASQERNLETMAMMYIALRTEEVYGWGDIPGAGLRLEPMPEEWMTGGRERAMLRLASFFEGEVHAAPTEQSQCRWCDLISACRVEQGEALVMVEGSRGA